MKIRSFTVIGAALLAVSSPLVAAPAFAQTPQVAQTQQAAQPQQVTPNPADFVNAAVQIGNAIDAGGAGQIWDTSAAAMKNIITRDQFIKAAQDRKTASGAIQNRQWASIRRQQRAAEGKVPGGDYLSVSLVGVNKDRKFVTETVSFYLEADRIWRMIGFSPN